MSYPYQIHSIEEYHAAYQKSVENPESFWADIASHFNWHRPWDEVLNWNFYDPKIEWFKGGKLNITENCLDRWVEKQPHTPAIIWEPNDPHTPSRTLTYQ